MFIRKKETLTIWLKDWNSVLEVHYTNCGHLGLEYINYKASIIDIDHIPQMLLIYKVIDEKLWLLTVLKYALKVV
jgi:hypothetical protein